MIISITKLRSYKKFEDRPELARLQFETPFCQTMIEDVRRNGILNPLVVKPRGDGDFDILLGHNRFLVAKHLGLMELPCVETIDTDPCALKALKKGYQRTAWDS